MASYQRITITPSRGIYKMLSIIKKAQALSSESAPYIKLYYQKTKDGEITDKLMYGFNAQARKIINDTFKLTGDNMVSNLQARHSGTQGDFFRLIIKIIEGDKVELAKELLAEGDDKAELEALIDKIKTIEYRNETE